MEVSLGTFLQAIALVASWAVGQMGQTALLIVLTSLCPFPGCSAYLQPDRYALRASAHLLHPLDGSSFHHLCLLILAAHLFAECPADKQWSVKPAASRFLLETALPGNLEK